MSQAQNEYYTSEDFRLRRALWALRDQVLLHGSDLDAALASFNELQKAHIAVCVEILCDKLGVKR